MDRPRSVECIFYRRIFTRRVRISLAEPSAECSALGFVLFPIGNRYLRWFRTLVAVVCAAALVYSESWLPGLDSIRGNFHNLAAMESGYLLDSALNFLNFEMIGAGIALIIIYYAIRDYIRVTTFTVGYLFILLCAPLWQPFVAQLRAPAPATEVVASVDNAKKPAEEERERPHSSDC